MENEARWVLIFARLTCSSSYQNNTQTAAGEVPDVVQFVVAPNALWRIRTFATDHDIHIGSMPRTQTDSEREAEECLDHIQAHYGTQLEAVHVLELHQADYGDEGAKLLHERGIPGVIMVPRQMPIPGFYTPDCAVYRPQSLPPDAVNVVRAPKQ